MFANGSADKLVMNFFKALPYFVFAAFFFFAGIMFYSKIPSGDRQPSSIRAIADAGEAKSKLNVEASRALQSCIDERVRGRSVALKKVTVDGRKWAIVSLDCSGEKAKRLYESVGEFSSEQYVKYSDGRSAVARFFGRLYPPSQCVRVIRTAKGSELNLYSCSIRIDIDHELTESLKL